MDNPFGTGAEEWQNFYEEMSPYVREVLKLLYEKEQSPSETNLSGKELLQKIAKRTEEPVYKYLDSLDMEIIKFIQTVMYIGRDYSGKEEKTPRMIYNEQKEELDFVGWNTKSIEINQMMGKAPLANYLREGLSKLELG